jgi:hypothetical protein
LIVGQSRSGALLAALGGTSWPVSGFNRPLTVIVVHIASWCVAGLAGILAVSPGVGPDEVLIEVLTIPARIDDCRAGVLSTIPAKNGYLQGCSQVGILG